MHRSALPQTLLGCLLFIINAVNSQDFLVALTAVPENGVTLGTTVNLTCTFMVGKSNFREAQFFENDMIIFSYPETSSGNWSLVEESGSALSDDPDVDSVVWMSFKASLCNDDSPERNYGCKPFTKRDETAQSEVTVAYALPEPVRTLSIDGEEVCQNGTHTSSITNSPQKLKISLSGERSGFANLTLKIGEETFESLSFENKTEECSHNAEIEAKYTFTESKDYLMEYSFNAAGGPVKESCVVTVTGSPSGMTTPAVEDSTGSVNGTSSSDNFVSTSTPEEDLTSTIAPKENATELPMEAGNDTSTEIPKDIDAFSSTEIPKENGSSTGIPKENSTNSNPQDPSGDGGNFEEGGFMSGAAIALCCVLITAFLLGVVMAMGLKKKKVSAKEQPA